MNILLDTNIMIDYLAKRPMFYENARKIIALCTEESVNGCIAAHSVTNAFYILRKGMTPDELREALINICEIFTVIGVDRDHLISALQNVSFTDIEDCLQTECAKDFSAEWIVTRNIKDFANSKIPAILPEDFLKTISIN
ncbi:MAG: PIN domain-containing protein [Bacteroides sp.]|nr:PIN domain-containing protein [Eubacterium sp.]MCM1419384.1 PIN domain-containing protein [Roseburia sp.]MCM1463206.1 PIN domain-containing protein [Bacteroides sp.]